MILFLAHWFTCASSILFEFWNFGDDCFCGGRKNRRTKRKTFGGKRVPTATSTPPPGDKMNPNIPPFSNYSYILLAELQRKTNSKVKAS